MESCGVPTDRRCLWRHLKLGFMFAPLACQAILDLNVLVFGRVAQHLETWVLGRELLIFSQNRLFADIRRASRHEANRILRPDVHQLFVILGPCSFNVCLVQFFDGRQVRGMRVLSQKPADSSAVGEKAGAEACEKPDSHEHRSTFHKASSAPSFVTTKARLSTGCKLSKLCSWIKP